MAHCITISFIKQIRMIVQTLGRGWLSQTTKAHQYNFFELFFTKLSKLHVLVHS